MSNVLNYDTVTFDDEKNSLLIIDQTLLPNDVKILSLTDKEDIWEAIHYLKVRGAPAIGVAAALGLAACSYKIDSTDILEFKHQVKDISEYLSTSRPTAVNLFWALDRMEKVLESYTGDDVVELKTLLIEEGKAIREEDIQMCRSIGEHGLSLINDGDGILTHCNAGQLATSKYGTALAPIHLGREKGMNFKVYTDETRPLLQGARLSSFELAANEVDTTVICDNMAAQVMKNRWVDIVFVGSDRIAANGDVCNKIGTLGVAILAKYYDIPFYALAPTSTIDMSLETGAEIPIEQRDPEEIRSLWYENPMVAEGIDIYNPAFDVTENHLVDGIITEHGIIRPPYGENLKKLFEQIE